MLKYQVFTTTQAENDIANIEDYITDELQAPLSVVKIIELIRRKIQGLNFVPERGRKVQDDRFVEERAVRAVKVQNFLVIFTVDKQKNRVYVLRAAYARREIKKLLS